MSNDNDPVGNDEPNQVDPRTDISMPQVHADYMTKVCTAEYHVAITEATSADDVAAMQLRVNTTQAETGKANSSSGATRIPAGAPLPGTPRLSIPAYGPPPAITPSVPLNATVTTVMLESTSGGAQTDVPFTFGQVFAAGELSVLSKLVGVITGQPDVPLQFNVLSTHDDGSVRHGAISGMLPALPAGALVPMALNHVANGASIVPLPQSAAPGAGFAATASIMVGGATYTASATEALLAGGGGLWLGGEVATDYIVHLPLLNGAVPHPHITVQFSVRFYPGANKAKVDVTFEHTKAYTAKADVGYDAEITIGGVAVYMKSALVHFPLARWKKTYWWNGTPAMHIKRNVAYLIGTKQVSNYNTGIGIKESTLAAYAVAMSGPLFDPMRPGPYQTYMPAAGGRPDIGLMPAFYASALLSQDKRAYAHMLASANAAGGWSAHVRDNSTGPGAGMPLSIVNWPYITILGNPGDAYNPTTYRNEKYPAILTTSNFHADTAHQAAFAYLPYLMTADHYYMEELLFWNNYNVLIMNPGYRGYENGEIRNNQVRAQGWCLRTLAQTAAVLPDAHPLKGHARYWLGKNFTLYDNVYTYANDNQLGFLSFPPPAYAMAGVAGVGMSPWMDDFFTQSLGHAIELGFTAGLPLMLWKAKFQIGRMTAPGYCFILGAIYTLRVRDTSTSAYYTTLAQAYTASVAPTVNAQLCNSPAYTLALNASLSSAFKPGEMTGYSGTPEGFPSNYQPALAMAVDSGYPGGAGAWAIFNGRSVKPDYTSNPQFSIVPRTV